MDLPVFKSVSPIPFEVSSHWAYCTRFWGGWLLDTFFSAAIFPPQTPPHIAREVPVQLVGSAPATFRETHNHVQSLKDRILPGSLMGSTKKKKSEKTNMKHKEEKFFNRCKCNEKDLVLGQTQLQSFCCSLT